MVPVVKRNMWLLWQKSGSCGRKKLVIVLNECRCCGKGIGCCGGKSVVKNVFVVKKCLFW